MQDRTFRQEELQLFRVSEILPMLQGAEVESEDEFEFVLSEEWANRFVSCMLERRRRHKEAAAAAKKKKREKARAKSKAKSAKRRQNALVQAYGSETADKILERAAALDSRYAAAVVAHGKPSLWPHIPLRKRKNALSSSTP